MVMTISVLIRIISILEIGALQRTRKSPAGVEPNEKAPPGKGGAEYVGFRGIGDTLNDFDSIRAIITETWTPHEKARSMRVGLREGNQ